MLITQSQLKSLLHYNQDTGLFTRLKGTRKLGWLNTRGYKSIGMFGREYKQHRLAWLYVYGYMPIEIDHINHNKEDNRIVNLRDVSHMENMRNSKRSKSNTSGVTGVNYDKESNKWRVRISIDGVRVNFGVFKNKEDAIMVRKEAERKYGYHKNHGELNE